jgi:hypothetical protein
MAVAWIAHAAGLPFDQLESLIEILDDLNGKRKEWPGQ